MVIDVHCHVGLSARRVEATPVRYSFEPRGAAGQPGFDSYLSPRLLNRGAWWFIRRWLGIREHMPGDALDTEIEASNQRHWRAATGVDRLVLLAFDEYHDAAGRPIGPARRRRELGSDLYASNSLVAAMCRAQPDRYLFGASIHPYRPDACRHLEELAAGTPRPVLVKWLPIHQNIDIADPRSVAFVRAAARLKVAMLVHYGGEMSLARQHMEFESPLPLLSLLGDWREASEWPTIIVAHAATPSFPLQSRRGHDALLAALCGPLADRPIYADISALSALGRSLWLTRLARRRECHAKLLWGSDFPIPVMSALYALSVPWMLRREVRRHPSWVEQSLRLARAAGFDERVFTQAATVLGVSDSPE